MNMTLINMSCDDILVAALEETISKFLADRMCLLRRNFIIRRKRLNDMVRDIAATLTIIALDCPCHRIG